MTPAEHIAQADAIMAKVDDPDSGLLDREAAWLTQTAIAHGVIAIAVELGVPHTAAAPVVPSGA